MQLSDIRSCNQLSMKHKRCIFKQTCSFVGNILERIALAYRNELWQWVSLLGNKKLHSFFYKRQARSKLLFTGTANKMGECSLSMYTDVNGLHAKHANSRGLETCLYRKF